MNILVLCTGNSARSILLECLLNRLSEGRVTAYSAGSKPSGAVHPQSLVLLAEKGFATSGLRSKSWDEFAVANAPKMDAVITVCGSAAGETCPIWPGAPVRSHWGVEDPAAAEKRDWGSAFETAFNRLKARAEALLSQDFESMNASELKSLLDTIGKSH